MGNNQSRDQVTGRLEPDPDPELVFDDHTVDGPGRDQRAQVVPFPPSGRGPGRHGGDQWDFRTEVHHVGGTEGAWLRQELAAVIRDLLVWAHEDMSRRVDQDHHHGEEERAA